jgi:signal transduction histidine kinase
MNNYLFRDMTMLGNVSQPFRLLLILEWLFLGTAAFMEVLLPFEFSWLLVWRVISIGLFGLMRLRLPTGKIATRWLYTAAECSLIFLAVTGFGLSARSVLVLWLVLVMRSCILLARSGQIFILGLGLLTYGTMVLTKPIVRDRILATVWDWRISNVLMSGSSLIFALLLINALLAERQIREELEIAHTQLRQYALRIEDQATLQERNRIAREIHDSLGHTLSAQTIQINNTLLLWETDRDRAHTFLKQAKQLGAEAMLEIRKSISMLRSNPLQGKSLAVAIEKLLTDFQHNTGITPTRKIDIPTTLTLEIDTTLYRIVQESLTNIHKHAQAQEIVVQLIKEYGSIELSIADNGRGFNPDRNTTGFGLRGMQERTVALGGKFYVKSQPANGCCISISLPQRQLR